MRRWEKIVENDNDNGVIECVKITLIIRTSSSALFSTSMVDLGAHHPSQGRYRELVDNGRGLGLFNLHRGPRPSDPERGLDPFNLEQGLNSSNSSCWSMSSPSVFTVPVHVQSLSPCAYDRYPVYVGARVLTRADGLSVAPPTKNWTAYKQVSPNPFNHRPLISSLPISPMTHRPPNNEDDFVGDDEDTVVCNISKV